MAALGSTPTSTSAATLTREGDLLAGLPTAIWTKIFAHFYSYEQDPSNRTLTPLLLSRPLSALALPELYRHPSVSYASLAALDAALKLPRLEADVVASLEAARLPLGGDGGRRWEEDKKRGTRASYVRSLTVWGRRERVEWGVKRAWDDEAAQDGVNDVVHTQNEGTGKGEEGEREEGEVLEPPEGTVSQPSVSGMISNMRTGSTRSMRATLLPPRPQRPPPPPPSTVHPLLPSLLSQVTLDTLVLKDTYIPDAASARVILSALESTVPRRAEIELRLWPADMVDPVRDRLLAHTPDLASRDAALARYAQARLLTPALIPGTLELHTAWLGAVMSGSRLDTSVLDAATDAAERIHAMLLEWIRGLYATRTGLVDYSGRPRVVEKVALDRAQLDAHLARLAEVGVNLRPWDSPYSHLSEPTLQQNPSHSFRHFLPATVPTKDQADARAAYDTFVDDMNRATWRACIEPLRALAHLATERPLRIAAHLSQVGQEEDVDGAEIPPSVPVADLEALLATVSAKPPRTPQAALLVLAGTFMRSTIRNAETECTGMRSLPTVLESGLCPDDFNLDADDLPRGCPGWLFRADDLIFDVGPSEPAEPNATVDYVPNPGVAVRADLELSSPLPLQTEGTSPDWSDMYDLAAASNVDPPSTSGAVRPLAWLANQVPILPASEHSTPLLLDDDPGLAYVLRERLAAIWAAWGRGELLNDDPKIPKSNKPCISLSLSAADPLAAQTITARNRSLYPRIGIQAISVTLPHALAPLSALGEADVERHPAGLGLLHPSTTSFQVRIHDEVDWADEMWYAGYLPPEVVRSFVQFGSGETRAGGGLRTGVKWMDDGEGKEAEEGGGMEIDSGDYASPDFGSDSSYVDVDESEMEPEFDGAEGETFDRAAAEEQARRIAARRAAKVV